MFKSFRINKLCGGEMKTPRERVSLLLKEKYWKDIPLDTLLKIADESNDPKNFTGFVLVSESLDLVEKYSNLAKRNDIATPLNVLFSLTLHMAGVRMMTKYLSEDDKTKRGEFLQMADLALRAALLCDALQINPYAYLALSYTRSNKDMALVMCEQYWNARDRFIAMPTDQLSGYYQMLTMEAEAPHTIDAFFDKISQTTDNPLVGSLAKHSSGSVMKFVKDLEYALQQLDPDSLCHQDVERLRIAIYQMV